jgi:predicted aspartyl protease
MRERHGWWAVPLLLFAFECAPSVRSLPLPIVESRKQTAVPLLDPLMVDVLAVETTVVTAADPPQGPMAVTFHLDSAATVSVLAEGLGRMLAPRPQEEARVALADPLGQAHSYRRVLVPRLRVGGFTWGQVHAVIAGNENLIGHDLLSQIPWEVDLDRGLLILDAEPWPSGAAQAELPVHRVGAGVDPDRPAWSRNDLIIVRLNGRDVSMLVDTGAALSAVPARVADALKLPSVPGPSQAYGVIGSGRMLGKIVTAELAFGNLSAGPRSFLVLPNDWSEGLLGLDVLRLFRFRMDSGGMLSLRRRGDRIETAAGRIARWPWIPHCERAGCAEAHIEGQGASAAIVMSVSVAYPDQPTSFLWTCRANAADPARLAVVVFVPRPVPDQPIRLVPHGAETDWAQKFAPCGPLAIVDIGPAGPVLAANGAVAFVIGMAP